MLVKRIGAAAMLLGLAACGVDESRQFSVVPVPAGSVVGPQPVATSQPIVLYPARPGLGQGSVIYTQPQLAQAPGYDAYLGASATVPPAPEVLVEPLDDRDPGLGMPPMSGGGWVLPE